MEINKDSIVPITYKGIVIGQWQAGTINFNSTAEAKEIMDKYLSGTINGVSSRKTGTVDELGNVTEDKVIEFSIQDAPPITSFEDVQAREKEIVNRVSESIDKEIIKKIFELAGTNPINWNIVGDNRQVIEYRIPIGDPNKKWWQFWKKSGFTKAEAENIMKELSKHSDYFIPTKDDNNGN